MAISNKIVFIIKALALKTSYPQLKQDYQIFFEEKITGDYIMDIEKKFADEIEDVAREELNNIRNNPLAHSRIRLEYMNKAMEYALKPRVIRSYKISDTEYGQEFDIDHQAIAKYLQLSRDEEYYAKKLLLEKIKLDLDVHNVSGYEPVEVIDGFTSVKQIDQAS